MKKAVNTIHTLKDKIIEGERPGRDEIRVLSEMNGDFLSDLFSAANAIRDHYRHNTVDLCSIVNAKSGGCSEDCGYCAQSSRSSAPIDRYPLKNAEDILKAAGNARENGARRFCIVTGGKKPNRGELQRIAEMISGVKKMGLSPCATLGLLDEDDLRMLSDAGLERYHHNLETSERFFPSLCTTHTYREKIKTIQAVKEAGLSLCSGGIFGLGETWADRIDMALQLRELDVDSVPVNFLTPVSGTPLGTRKTLPPLEALKIISIYRFILPEKQIRVCGGRMQTLGELNSFIFMAGADGLLVGNYLTTLGRSPEEDLGLIGHLGLKY